MKTLEKHFSIYIRTRSAENGLVRCITCGRSHHWKHVLCSRFAPGDNLRFHENNCYPQCKTCAGYKDYLKPKFAQEIDKLHGSGMTETLIKLSEEQRIYNELDIKLLTEYYKNI